MSVKPEGPFKDIKTDVIHHPVKATHLNFSSDIYILLSTRKSALRGTYTPGWWPPSPLPYPLPKQPGLCSPLILNITSPMIDSTFIKYILEISSVKYFTYKHGEV